MTTLYNCHSDGDQYRITKFDSLGNVESSYLCTEEECECPAGVRPTCRHRKMLPSFLKRGAVDTFWFFDFDRGGWVMNEPATGETELKEPALETDSIPPLPDGIQVFTLDGNPGALHNTIAEALGEPLARPTSLTLRRRV